jgi:D-alanine-D-alanine ligase
LDENNKAWFLEVNTLPGMTETSLVPKSVAAFGLSFSELIQIIIKEAMKD